MKNFRALSWIFVCVLIYAVVAMTISRELVIPRFIPSEADGHIKGDPYNYHVLALEKSFEIRSFGFERFELRPAGQGPAGIASIAYFVYASPYSVVLINAVLHAVSSVVMGLILLRWFPLRATLIAIAPLVISPYMIIWFSQINKDSYTLAGVLLFIFGVIRILDGEIRLFSRSGLVSLFVLVAGISILWIVRPYLNKIFMPIAAILFSVVIFVRFVNNPREVRLLFALAIYGVFVMTGLALLSHGSTSDETVESFYSFKLDSSFKNNVSGNDSSLKNNVSGDDGHFKNKILGNSEFFKCLESIDENSWRNEDVLPDILEKNLRAIMGHRCLMFSIITTHDNLTTLSSIVDTEILPSGSFEALSYFPRGALLGIFSPWPVSWGFVFQVRPSFFYTVVPLEAFILYVGLVGLLLWIFMTRRWSILIPALISVGVMSIYGSATPFLGALYRYRYPFWMLMICIGVAASYEIARVRTHDRR